MTRILVTTDSSDLGQHALPHAQALAKALGAGLIVLSVQLDPAVAAYGDYAYAMPGALESLDERKVDLEAELQARVPDAKIIVERAGGRHVSRAIIDVAQEEGAAMIVMTTHGRSGLGRALLGSVAQAVAHYSPVPVLLIKGDQPPVDWGDGADHGGGGAVG